MKAIEARDLYKSYARRPGGAYSLKERLVRGRGSGDGDEFWALKGVGIEVEAGSFHGLIGRNGSGKSTLLKVMAGIQQPTAGSMTVNGRVAALLELGSGFHPELTGRENIYLNAAILGIGRKHMNQVIDEVIDFSGISGFVEQPVKTLSSGMYVRLGFAVAVHVRPEVLLIDEVIAVGDEEFQRKCLNHLHKLRLDGVTIVLVSHSTSLIEQLCDSATWLDHGSVAGSGHASEVCSAYLKAVNDVELERLGDAGESSLRSGTDLEHSATASNSRRRGSGEIRLEQMHLVDSAGDPQAAVRSGEPFRLRFWFQSDRSLPEMSIGVTFRQPGGTVVARPSMLTSGCPGRVDQVDEGYVDLVIDRLALLPGEYEVTAEVLNGSHSVLLDAWDEPWVLRVQPGASKERIGFIDLGARWEFVG